MPGRSHDYAWNGANGLLAAGYGLINRNHSGDRLGSTLLISSRSRTHALSLLACSSESECLAAWLLVSQHIESELIAGRIIDNAKCHVQSLQSLKHPLNFIQHALAFMSISIYLCSEIMHLFCMYALRL